MERGVSKLEILTQLCRSPHSALTEYIPVGQRAAREESEFLAHLVSYDAINGSIRDAHAALPVISLSVPEFNDPEFIDNSLAHLAKLSPRELRSAYLFAMGYVKNKDVVPNPDPEKAKRWKTVRVGGWKRFTRNRAFLNPASRRRQLDRLVSGYLRHRESNAAALERNLIQFRSDIVALYGLSHTAMSDYAKTIIMDKVRPAGSAMEAIADLGRLDPKAAAAAIVEHRIPFLMLLPILKDKVKDPVLLMAIIDRMSPSELQTNMKSLEKLGVKDYPETRAALEQSLKRMETSRKTVLKTTKAAEGLQDQVLKSKVREAQEKQISNMAGIQGNWLVLGDCSASMGIAVETAKLVAGTLARFVKDKVALVFFNDSPRYFDVTGKSLDEINQITRHITANGWTSIGCGLLAAVERRLDIQGIAIVSDGGENWAPLFVDQYRAVCKSMDRQIPVYYYKVGVRSGGYLDDDTLQSSMRTAGCDLQLIDLRSTKVDAYSMPNLVQNLRTNRYSVLDEVYGSMLLTVDQVLGVEKERMVVTC